MITLAEKSWKLEINQAIRKLIINGLLIETKSTLSQVDQHKKIVNDRHNVVNAFWQHCQGYHLQRENAKIRMLQRHFHVSPDTAMAGERLTRIIGACTTEDTAKYFHKARYEYKKQLRNGKSGSFDYVDFPGRNWNELLAVPFYDLPGRICGYLFIGRDGDPEDFVFKQVLPYYSEGGLAMLDGMFQERHSLLGHTKFIMTDIQTALCLHGRQAKDSSKILPMACAYEAPRGTTANVWDWLRPQDVVFWGPDVLKTIRLAMPANGQVTIAKYTRDIITRNSNSLSAAGWLHRMKQRAVHWSRALQDILNEADDLQAEEILLSLEMSNKDISEFINHCDDTLRERLKHLAAHGGLSNRTRFERQWVVEKPTGWYLEKTNDCISSVIIRIHQVISAHAGDTYYRGELRFHEQVYPFTEHTKIIDKLGALRWAHKYLRDTLKGGAAAYYPSWNAKGLQLALSFNPPENVHHEFRIGWRENLLNFQLPNFAITRSGIDDESVAGLFQGRSLPAMHLPPPGVIPRTHIANLSFLNNETRIVWATAVAVLTNIISPAVNRNQPPILLDGEDTQRIGVSTAKRMGCLTTTSNRVNRICPQLKQNAAIHDWPYIVENNRWSDELAGTNGIYRADYATTRILGIRKNVHIVSDHTRVGSMQLTTTAVPHILTNYLQDLINRKMCLPENSEYLAENILTDIAAWFSRIGGNNEAILNVSEILWFPSPETACKCFFDLVFYLYTAGKLNYARAAFTEEKEKENVALLAIEGKDAPYIWISQERFSLAARRNGGLSPDLLLITQSLQQLSLLQKEHSLENQKGWLITDTLWNKKIRLWRKNERRENC